jgi:(4S)-4-hydroxy-5-phosphonooxypentane-2,3-dione isomerase
MHIIVVSLQLNEEYRDAFVEAVVEEAQAVIRDEPGCLCYDVVQDGADSNRIWLYEVYKDAAAHQAHLQTPHFLKLQAIMKPEWMAAPPQVSGEGSHNIWPSDEEWK